MWVEVLENQVCKYGEDCTFAYCQEEIDVWTQERRGLLVRELLFNPLATNGSQTLSVVKLLNIHTGMFMFLCEVKALTQNFMIKFGFDIFRRSIKEVILMN